MESSQPAGPAGAREAHQQRVREVVARLADEAVRLTDKSPRKVTELLAELGWFGRGQEPFSDSTVRGWTNGEFPMSAWVFVGLALHHGVSVDELIWGKGLKAEVDRLRDAGEERDRQLAGVQNDLQTLRDVIVSHLRLSAEDAAAVGRIAGPG